MAGNLTAMIAAAFSGGAAPPVTTDPYFDYTTLLLPGNGTNGAQNNTFLDGSTNNFTITRNGNTTQGTFSPFSQTGWGNYFSGSSQYLSLSDNAAFAFGSGDLTIECWVYATTSGLAQGIAGQANSSVTASATSFILYLSSISKISVEFYVGSTIYAATSSNNLVYNQWNHIAVVRDGGTIRLYINGQQDGTVAISGTINDSTNQLAIGRPGEYNSWYWNGYISNFRIVKGRCVYPSGTAFNPPTAPLTRTTGGTNPPQGTECSLLTCQSNSFLDSNGVNVPASSPLTITANGSPTVVAFSPFNPSASWSASTYGGSGYFDGSGDYLTLAANSAFAIGTGDFTFDCWLYPLASNSGLFVMTASGVNDLVITNNWNPSTGGTTNGTAAVIFASTVIAGPTNAVVQNAWNHIAVVRSSGSIRVYVNGLGGTQTSNTYNITGSYNPTIGALYTHSPSATPACYMFNMRLVKGTAVYDPTSSTITVPTSPLTAITNTSLLLNFTNAGIYDATSKNDLETVGNAQISTAISAKWGSGSMAFDGTGDYLLTQSSNLLQLGTGQFTIEAWFYKTASTGGNVFSSKTGPGNDSTSIGLYVDATLMYVWGNGAQITASSPSLNAWHYVAITRNSSNLLTLWLNGSSVGTLSSFTADLSKDKFAIGALTNGTETFFGYIQDLRITKGYARTITTPTAAFPTL